MYQDIVALFHIKIRLVWKQARVTRLVFVQFITVQNHIKSNTDNFKIDFLVTTVDRHRNF